MIRPSGIRSRLRSYVTLSALALGACGSELPRPNSETCDVDAACSSGLCYEGQCLDPAADSDGDGLSNGLEAQVGSSPLKRDSDDDGRPDGTELDAQWANIDGDRDGFPNILESATADLDGDCIPDQYDAENSLANPDGCWLPSFVSPDEAGLVSHAGPFVAEVRVHNPESLTRDFGGFAGFVATLSVDGRSAEVNTERTVPPDGLVRFEVLSAPGTHQLAVAVTDARGMVRHAERTVIVNSPPGAPEIAITPERPTTDDALTVNILAPPVDTTIASSGAITYSVAWRRLSDGDVWPNETLYADRTARGDIFEVIVTPEDGFGPGEPARREVTIGNSAPACDGVVLLPSTTSTRQPITCRCTEWRDADADPDESTCAFVDLVSGQPIDTDGACTVPPTATEKGMVIGCTLTPGDGDLFGEPVASAPSSSVLVLNSAPSAPSVTLTPTAGDAGMDFACELAVGSTDADGDSVTYAVAWQLYDASVPAAPVVQPATLGAKKGDVLCCGMTASDGAATSTPSTPACTTLTNAAPTLDGVTVGLAGSEPGTTAPTRRDVLNCALVDAHDADNDALTATFAWYAGDAVVADATTETLAAASLAVGTSIACGARLCDDAGACTPERRSKNAVTIANALPAIAQVAIPDADGQAERDQVLTCDWSGWDDPDGDSASVRYTWLVSAAGAGTLSPIADATASTLTIDATFVAGDVVACRVTPLNGADAGAPRDSDNRITIVAPTPIAPTVAVEAPAGAEGTATCVVETPGKWIPAGAHWTWYWSVNGAPEAVGAEVLAADALTSCDLLRCRVAITAPDVDLTSNVASLQMPLGADCEDGDPCTTALCFAGGGCNMVPLDGVACDDGDPCTDQEACDGGTCVGSIDLCTEDRVSVSATSVTRPALAAIPGGGWVAQWYGAAVAQQWMRGTDGDESRIGTELNVAAGSGSNYWNEPVVAGDGTVAILRVEQGPAQIYVSCGGCTAQAPAGVHLQRYASTLTANGDQIDDQVVSHLYWSATAAYPNWGVRQAGIGPAKVQLVALGDGRLGALRAYENGAARTGIMMTPIGADQAVGADVELVAGAQMGNHDLWDVASVPDGSNGIIAAWVGADGKSVLALRFSATGVPEFGAPLAVATLAGSVSAVRVEAMPNGRFVVLWEGAGIDPSGLGIGGQRFDAEGSLLGDPLGVTTETSGDQRLGDVAVLAGYQFVVGYRDASSPTPVEAARIFSSTGNGGARIVLNEATTPGALPPSVVALDTSEWIAAWVDAAGVVQSRRYAADGTTAPRAAEFRANDEASNTQETPAAAAVLSGNLMVAYASKVYPSGPYATEIVTRVFDPDGLEVRPEQMTNTTIQGAQTTPVVAAGTDRFVVAWNSDEEDGSVDGLFARIFDAEGVPLGAATGATVATADYQRQPAVVMAPDGRWALAWNGFSDVANSSSDAFVRVFPKTWPASGEPTVDLRVNTTTDGPQERPAMALVPFANEVVIAWQSRGQDGSGYGIFARKFGLDGTALAPELPVNSTTAGDQRNPTITVGQNGTFAVCWESVGQGSGASVAVACQRLRTSDLTPQGAEFLPLVASRDQASPVARTLVSGQLAVAWAGLGVDAEGYGVQLVRVNDLGQTAGTSINVNRFWSGDQTRPWIVPSDDRLVVGWQSTGQDGAEGGVYFRVLPF